MMACGLSGEGVVGQATNVLTMAVQNNGLGTRTGGITGGGFLPGQSGNPGGRPKGLAAAARGAVGDDGRDLVAFFSAVMRGDRKALGERRPVALRERVQAATWLADRAYGKAVQVVEIPEDPRQEQVEAIRQEVIAMPPELKRALGEWLLAKRTARLRAQREEIERNVQALMPPEQPNPDGDGTR